MLLAKFLHFAIQSEMQHATILPELASDVTANICCGAVNSYRLGMVKLVASPFYFSECPFICRRKQRQSSHAGFGALVCELRVLPIRWHLVRRNKIVTLGVADSPLLRDSNCASVR